MNRDTISRTYLVAYRHHGNSRFSEDEYVREVTIEKGRGLGEYHISLAELLEKAVERQRDTQVPTSSGSIEVTAFARVPSVSSGMRWKRVRRVQQPRYEEVE